MRLRCRIWRRSTSPRGKAVSRQLCKRLLGEGNLASRWSFGPTVVLHLSTAAKKLGARNRTQAAAMAVRLGLLGEPRAASDYAMVAKTRS
ncbi:hypothetical protein MES5069_60118 [Mesorhizobium escarrei]|uniref:HTH luxR-type domain-containing protein n=1 Tax=Mesorhizobium escarrei TaxID=666018 RepID=A0ABN8KDG1_9HYPH|nr:hypothetical protein MES5069_60118 [Mesorhizobium escarrei]